MLHASMYFRFGRDARPEVTAATTFDAILAGQRTATTRFPAWPGHARWLALAPGDRVTFYADRDMRGRSVVCEITHPPLAIDLATCGEAEIETWSQREGWTVSAGRGFGRRYGSGTQIRYRVLQAAGG